MRRKSEVKNGDIDVKQELLSKPRKQIETTTSMDDDGMEWIEEAGVGRDQLVFLC